MDAWWEKTEYWKNSSEFEREFIGWNQRMAIAEKMGYKFKTLNNFLEQEKKNPEIFNIPNLSVSRRELTRTEEKEIRCPKCGTGRLMFFNGKKGGFWGCDEYNRTGCAYKVNAQSGHE